MKTSDLIVTVIESEDDVQSYRDSTGMVFPAGSCIVKGILNDSPEGIRPFMSVDAAREYVNETVFGESETKARANKSTVKSKPAKSTKKTSTKKGKK